MKTRYLQNSFAGTGNFHIFPEYMRNKCREMKNTMLTKKSSPRTYELAVVRSSCNL